MTELATDIAPIETPSTVIDTETETAPSGAGVPRTLPDADAKAPFLRDTIADVVKEEAKEAKAEPVKSDAEVKEAKPDEEKTEAKPAAERAPDGKFVAKPKEGEEAPTADAQAPVPEQAEKDAKHYPEPPKNFLPDSRELYRNVPRAVRRDIDVMVREHDAFKEQARQSTERYESIRPFDELARSNGRDLRESLARMNQVENALQRDPIYGLNEILKEIGPRKADGSPVSIYEMASHIVEQGPQQFQQRLQQVQSSQPTPPDPRIEQAQRERDEAHEQLVTATIIAPFKAEHPRYDELQDTIAGFLQSGMISSSLSAPERLEAAYVMAERHVPPSSHPAETEAPAPIPQDRAAESLSGSKSIKSAPGAVSADMEPERGGEIIDILRDEVKRMRRS
jgi:hypothetical protein